MDFMISAYFAGNIKLTITAVIATIVLIVIGFKLTATSFLPEEDTVTEE